MSIYVNRVRESVMEQYNWMRAQRAPYTDSRLRILKSTRVNARALVRSLEDFSNNSQYADLRSEVRRVIYQIEDMHAGGETRLFTCHSAQRSAFNSELEFVCVAVRKYKIEGGEEVVDYYLATYNYEKTVDLCGVITGIATVVGAVGFGVLTLATGGGAAVVAIGLAGSAAIGTVGAVTARNALDTSIPENMKTMLEASFLYELVTRGHAVLGQDRRLYITNG